MELLNVLILILASHLKNLLQKFSSFYLDNFKCEWIMMLLLHIIVDKIT